jgi:RHS repeat-associated protein
MVKSVIGDVTTYYAGSYYEKKVVGSEQVERKYYFAGSSRIAMRENGALTWLLSDNLGSTSTTAAADGSLLDVVKYTAFGEIRNGATVTDYRYTGQRDEFEIGLYYYVARYYDPMVGRFISADTIVPQPGSSQAYDRYAYSNNNPINYNDFSGHAAGWFGNFLHGFSAEFVRTNNWVGAITAPTVAQSLAPSSSESNAMLAGRIVADLATLAVGITEIIGGGTIAGGGAVVGCGATLCLASAPAIAAGAAVISAGVMTTASGSVGLGENLGIVFSKRHRNDLHPDPEAAGAHSTFKQDPVTGTTTNYETYQPQTNPNNPNPWQKILRYDGIGRPHNESSTGIPILPHIHDFITNIIRKPFWYEVPK